MNVQLSTSLRHWLEGIMPSVAATLVDILNPERLQELSQEGGVAGPFRLNLENFRAPITALHFYTVVTDAGLLLAVKVIVKGQDGEIMESPGIQFDMFFTLSDFPTDICDEEHLRQLVDTIMEYSQELL